MKSISRWKKASAETTAEASGAPLTEDVTLYIGPIHRKFGHFVVESLSRSWFIQHARSLFGKDRLKYLLLPEVSAEAAGRPFGFSDLMPWQAQFLNMLGITAENSILLTDLTRFSNLIVPEPGLLYGGKHDSFAAKVISNRVPAQDVDSLWPDADTKIFLTRGPKYLRAGYVAGTRYFDEFFASNGYRVIDNETRSALEQVAWIRKAQHVMAIQSSSMHIFNVISNPKIKFGYLWRLSPSLDRKMSHSLMGLLNTDLNLTYSNAFSPPENDKDKFRICVYDDIEKLHSFFKSFDPSIDLGKFDVEKYLKCVEEDVANATSPKPQ